MKKKDAIIVDLDWCVAFEPFIGDIPKSANRDEWDKFHKDHCYYSPEYYKPIEEIINLITSFYIMNNHIKIFFITSREDSARGLIRLNSYRFIKNNFSIFNSPGDYGNTYELLMRKENDYRPSATIKEDFLVRHILKKYNVLFALDDDSSNREMFVKHGITTLQVYSKDVQNLLNDSVQTTIK